MTTTLDLEIGSLVDCARQLSLMICSTHYPRYQVLEGNICSDGNLTGVSLAKALIQHFANYKEMKTAHAAFWRSNRKMQRSTCFSQNLARCTKGIEDIVLEFDRMLFYNGFCGNLSFATSVATPRPLISCLDHTISIVADLKKRMRQQDYSNVSLISTQIRDTSEHLQQDQSFVRCERVKSDICELKSELKDKDMLIELITGLVGDECPRINEIINQYHQQLNHTENQHKQKQVDELTERIQLLETDNSHWQCVVIENIQQLNDCQTKNLLLETRKNDWKSAAKKKGQQLKECQARFDELQRQLESTVNNTAGRYEDEKKLKQEMHNLSASNRQLQELFGNWSHLQTVKEEEIKHLNQTYDDLSARNNALEDELSYFKRRVDVRGEELITIKKDNEELLMRSDELEKEVTGFKQTLSLRDVEQKTMRKENEEILTKLNEHVRHNYLGKLEQYPGIPLATRAIPRVCELEKEITILKQMLDFREEELNSINEEKEDLLTRNAELGNEVMMFRQRLILRDELITTKKEKEELLMRSDELEKEVTGLKQTLILRDEEQTGVKKENEEILTRNAELENEVMIFSQRLNLRDEKLITTKKEKEELMTRNNALDKEVSYFKQRHDVREEELITIKKEKEELLVSSDELEKEVTGFKQTLSLRDEELMAMKEEKEEVLTKVDELENEVTILKQRLYYREEELKSINQQKEDLLTRLSQYTSAQLVHDNPNVADLSDLNRPTKLAEKFSELYDNEWTDGFEVLTENQKFTEREAIRQLLDILLAAYKFCTKISNQQERMIKQAFLSPVAEDVGEDATTELNSVQLRTIFDLRKQTSHWSLITAQKGFLNSVKSSGLSSPDATQLIRYINQCAELCWHMVIRSPPLMFESPASEGGEFDKTKYKFYQTSGMNMDFVVWPVLCLYKDGPLLSKGIAEAM